MSTSPACFSPGSLFDENYTGFIKFIENGRKYFLKVNPGPYTVNTEVGREQNPTGTYITPFNFKYLVKLDFYGDDIYRLEVADSPGWYLSGECQATPKFTSPSGLYLTLNAEYDDTKFTNLSNSPMTGSGMRLDEFDTIDSPLDMIIGMKFNLVGIPLPYSMGRVTALKVDSKTSITYFYVSSKGGTFGGMREGRVTVRFTYSNMRDIINIPTQPSVFGVTFTDISTRFTISQGEDLKYALTGNISRILYTVP